MAQNTITKATLAVEQAMLDNHKYFKSMEAQTDLSGAMDYCYNCVYRRNNSCALSHEERIVRSACAANSRGICAETLKGDI